MYIKHNETMTIGKHQLPWLTFVLSAKVASQPIYIYLTQCVQMMVLCWSLTLNKFILMTHEMTVPT